MLALDTDFIRQDHSTASLTEVLDLAAERALFLILEGPEEGLGLLILAGDLVTGLVEVMTTGRCNPHISEPRRPTRTDAAMIAPLIDLALENLEESLAEEDDLIWTSGFRYASYIEEARPLGLLLEDETYQVMRADLGIGHGARQGQIALILPQAGRGRVPPPRIDAAPAPDLGPLLRAQIEDVPVTLDAVLARMKLTVGDLNRLAIGQVLTLSGASLDQIALCGLDGQEISRARLGQQRGLRALRVQSGEDSLYQTAQSATFQAFAAGHHMENAPDDIPEALDEYPAMASFAATGTE